MRRKALEGIAGIPILRQGVDTQIEMWSKQFSLNLESREEINTKDINLDVDSV